MQLFGVDGKRLSAVDAINLDEPDFGFFDRVVKNSLAVFVFGFIENVAVVIKVSAIRAN